VPIAVPLRSAICHSPTATSRFTLEHLEAQFSRNRQTLLLVVRKVLGNDERAGEVVANCLARACERFRTFADEAELRRWLVRLAIDEALCVRGGSAIAG
jgi:DNA-directed RNA polymerase specialized sigma24 family protein